MINIDETNVPFSVDLNTIYTEINNKTASTKQANMLNQVTTLLGVTLNDEMLTLFFIFKA